MNRIRIKRERKKKEEEKTKEKQEARLLVAEKSLGKMKEWQQLAMWVPCS